MRRYQLLIQGWTKLRIPGNLLAFAKYYDRTEYLTTMACFTFLYFYLRVDLSNMLTYSGDGYHVSDGGNDGGSLFGIVD